VPRTASPRLWEGPIGRQLLALGRGAPRWRSPKVSLEFGAAFDLGIVGIQGVALWMPGAYQLRQHRRQQAAHLRYLFDHLVSPWQRHGTLRTRREAWLVFWRARLAPIRGREASIADVCSTVRKRWPSAYVGEGREVTMRRLYRISAQQLRRARHPGHRRRRSQ
jgi:hypothetical protein